jgi:Ca-activated chloride channel family protein
MTFLASGFLWLLLLVPALAGAYLALLRRRKPVVVYSDVRLVRAAVTPAQALRRYFPPFLFLLALVSLLLAIARPAAVVSLLSAQRTIVLAIDVSLSMAATDVEPSRLAAAQAAAKGFIREQPGDVRVGIVSFAGTADLVQPPTANRARLFEAIDRLRLDYHTAIGSGILAALSTIFPEAGVERGYDIFGGGNVPATMRAVSLDLTKSSEGKKQKPVAPGSYASAAIILLTDGSRTMGPDPLAAAKAAADLGVRVFTVGFGASERAHVAVDGWSMDVGFDEASLKDIAAITHGAYFHADTAERLRRVYRELSSRFVVERKEIELAAVFTAAAALLSLAAAVTSFCWCHRAA